MVTFLSLLFTAAGLTSAVLVVINKVPMNGALFLVITLFTVAANYVLLGAEFLAAVQVIVYAGAIMVLIMFVIQLVGFQPTKDIHQKQAPMALAIVSLIFLQVIFFTVRSISVIAKEAKQSSSVGAALVAAQSGQAQGLPLQSLLSRNDISLDHTASFSETLFTKYLLPFEMASVLLLVAIVGTVLLAQHKGIRE